MMVLNKQQVIMSNFIGSFNLVFASSFSLIESLICDFFATEIQEILRQGSHAPGKPGNLKK